MLLRAEQVFECPVSTYDNSQQYRNVNETSYPISTQWSKDKRSCLRLKHTLAPIEDKRTEGSRNVGLDCLSQAEHSYLWE